jgi:hypothetical protein
MVADGWNDIHLEDEYPHYLFLSGKRTMPDPPELEPVLVDGLVMARLSEMRDSNYKLIEMDLKNIKNALEPFRKADKAFQRPTQFQQDDDFNPFSRSTTAPAVGPDGRPGPQPVVGPRPGPGGGGKNTGSPAVPPRPGDTTTNVKPLDPVQFNLIRLIDVTHLEPGKNYEYRIKVRMANPNYGKPTSQVANPKDTENKYLESQEWYQIPGRLVVPSELSVYAVDQLILDKELKVTSDDVNKAEVNPKTTAVLQFQRWVDKVGDKPVGEWAVAERVLVNRGEVIDRNVKVRVPWWNTNLDAFAFVNSSSDPKGVEVRFGNPRDDSVLLDFDNGDVAYVRGPGQTVRDKTARAEVLILTPDGRIQAHDTATDKDSKERQEKLAEYRRRLEEVKTGVKSSTPANPTASPFGR